MDIFVFFFIRVYTVLSGHFTVVILSRVGAATARFVALVAALWSTPRGERPINSSTGLRASKSQHNGPGSVAVNKTAN